MRQPLCSLCGLLLLHCGMLIQANTSEGQASPTNLTCARGHCTLLVPASPDDSRRSRRDAASRQAGTYWNMLRPLACAAPPLPAVMSSASASAAAAAVLAAMSTSRPTASGSASCSPAMTWQQHAAQRHQESEREGECSHAAHKPTPTHAHLLLMRVSSCVHPAIDTRAAMPV